jgi:diacylglycerol kinase family enzyme
MNPAFAYVYDEALSDRRFEREVSAVEAELARQNLQGCVIRMGMFRSMKEMVSDFVRAGVTTVVLVGGDATLSKALWLLPDLGVTVGLIPVMEPMVVPQALGIPRGAKAVETLAARFVERLDVGRIEERCFLTEVVSPVGAELDIDGKFRVGPVKDGALAIRNVGLTPEDRRRVDPRDGQLDAFIQTEDPTQKRGFFGKPAIHETHMRFQQGTILSPQPIEIFVDGQALLGTQFRLKVDPGRLKVITGRQRLT